MRKKLNELKMVINFKYDRILLKRFMNSRV